MWSSSAGVFATALILAVAATPLARRLALRSRFVDYPAARKDHREPMPLLGGLAIYAAVLGSLLLHPGRGELVGAAAILLGATLVSFLGIWDDRSGVRVSVKLAGQLVATLVLVVAGIQVLLPIPAALNLLLTVLWVMGITNALNLIDNMDGLAGGVGAISAAIFLVLAIAQGQILVAPLAAALLGACIGFLFYNFNPARIFMGDSGSLFLGFVLAAVGIKLRFPLNTPQATWVVPVLVLAVPILDTCLVVYSRLRRGHNPLVTPGRDHLSHRLVEGGWSRREAVLMLYLLAVAFGGLGCWVSRLDPGTASVVGIGALAAGLAAVVWLDHRRARS